MISKVKLTLPGLLERSIFSLSSFSGTFVVSIDSIFLKTGVSKVAGLLPEITYESYRNSRYEMKLRTRKGTHMLH